MIDMSQLWCSVCMFILPGERPKDYDELTLTIIGGFLVCEEHTPYAPPNTVLNNYTRYKNR